MSGRGQGPLAGVRVLDLTSVLMGPYATQIFADLGADVIKIESPDGDTTRYIPPGPDVARGAMFLNVNRGKRSLALDLKQPSAREALLRMAADADVFIHSMRSQAIGRLGLDYAALSAANPRIIYANLYGFARNGPYRDYPAYDDIVQAASGIVDLQARLSGGQPTYSANVIADKVAGLTGAYSVMAALYAREKTGLGQEIEIPMFETMVSFATVEHLCGSLFVPPQGPPEYPRATMRSRTENIGKVLAKVAEVLLTRTSADWVELFRAAQIPATAIASLTDLMDDPHLVETGFWEQRETDAGTLRFPGIPTTFSATPGAIGDPGPSLGGDSEAVLREAGFAEADIAAMIETGAVRIAVAK